MCTCRNYWEADSSKANRRVYELLWWLHVRLLVTRWQVRLDRRPGRPSVNMVVGRTANRRSLPGSSLVGDGRGFRSMEVRRP